MSFSSRGLGYLIRLEGIDEIRSDLASNVINLKQHDQTIKHSKCFWENDWGRKYLSKSIGRGEYPRINQEEDGLAIH